jgi:hypothetical protein
LWFRPHPRDEFIQRNTVGEAPGGSPR